MVYKMKIISVWNCFYTFINSITIDKACTVDQTTFNIVRSIVYHYGYYVNEHVMYISMCLCKVIGVLNVL